MECPCRETKDVYVKVPADLSSTGQDKWRFFPIDKCISGLVENLQKSGVDMRSSCCSHGNGNGEIILADGQIIKLRNKYTGVMGEKQRLKGH